MSMPSIPDITPKICLSRTDSINILLTSIAEEELALAKLLEAEQLKLLSVISQCATPHKLLQVNASIESMVRAITSLEMILQLKLNSALSISESSCLHANLKDHCYKSTCDQSHVKNDCNEDPFDTMDQYYELPCATPHVYYGSCKEPLMFRPSSNVENHLIPSEYHTKKIMNAPEVLNHYYPLSDSIEENYNYSFTPNNQNEDFIHLEDNVFIRVKRR